MLVQDELAVHLLVAAELRVGDDAVVREARLEHVVHLRRAARALQVESVDAMLSMEDGEIDALERAVQAEHRNLVERGLIAP